MIVEEIREVIRDKIFSRHSQIQGVPVQKLSPHVSVKEWNLFSLTVQDFHTVVLPLVCHYPLVVHRQKIQSSILQLLTAPVCKHFQILIPDSVLQECVPDSILGCLRAVKHTSL